MRLLLSASCVALIVAVASSGAGAQSAIVDLSKPQAGKSRFVLNADMTPADLGAVEKAMAKPVAAAVSRVPACGEGCKMEQPDIPKESRPGFIALPGYSPFDQERTRAYIAENALKIHNATKNERRKFRRRR